MKEIKKEFLSRGILRGGTLVLRPEDALDMIRRCREVGVVILGIDGFRITEKTTQPVMEESIDISTHINKRNTWLEAEVFVTNRIDTDLYFEVVI